MDFDDSSRTLSAGSVLSEETLIPEEDDISDEQIDFLLQRASLRMKSKSNALTFPETSTTRLPQLKGTSELPAPYTTVQGGVARMEEKKTVNDEQRLLAEKPKKIEDPVSLKRSKKEREFLTLFLGPKSCFCVMMCCESPFASRRRLSAPFWMPSCTDESSFFS
jgi:hypothetical protein